MSSDSFKPATNPVVARLQANHRQFLNFLTARVGNREDAEEILQDAFVRGLQKSGGIRDDESATAWFYRLLRNAITDHHRRKNAGDRAMESYARDVPDADQGFVAELERAVCACINDLIPNLKPEYADLIRQVDLGGAEVASVADQLGLTAGNARVRLYRARAALRHELERCCRTCATHGCLDCTCSRPARVPPQ
jgi:RNA polymerase sigma-70 factor (ECF subfamily)